MHPSIDSTIHPATSCKLVGSNLEAAHNPPGGEDSRKVNKGLWNHVESRIHGKKASIKKGESFPPMFKERIGGGGGLGINQLGAGNPGPWKIRRTTT